MAKEIRIVVPHSLGIEGARERVEKASAALKAEFGAYASTTTERWIGNRLEFDVRALGASASGAVNVAENKLHIVVRLPLLLRPFAGQIEGYVAQHGPKYFA